MSEFDVARWRPAPFLPESDARDGSLTFVVAVLCFLACLTLLAVLAADRAARDWTDQLEGQATIIVRPKANETPDGAAARAAETLAGVDGVAFVFEDVDCVVHLRAVGVGGAPTVQIGTGADQRQHFFGE